MLAHSALEQALGSNFNLYVLATVLLILVVGVLASLIAARRELASSAPDESSPAERSA
jgi:hypothetical protein